MSPFKGESARLWAALPYLVLLLSWPSTGVMSASPMVGDQQSPHDLTSAAASALPWVKIEVDTDGVYTVTGGMLQAAGWSLDEVNADALRLTSQGEDVAFEINGAEGGHLSPTSALRFFGERFRGDRLAGRYAGIDMHWGSFPTQKPDGSFDVWSPTLDATMFEKYTSTNVYWLRADGTAGPRIGSAREVAGPQSPVSEPLTEFTNTVRFDEAHIWYTFHFTGSDSFVWARINSVNDITQAFTLTLSGAGVAAADPLTSNRTATVRVTLIARLDRRNHRSAFALNGMPIGEAVWHGASRMTYEASLPSDRIRSGANVFTWQFLPGGEPDYLYLDWLELTYARDLDARGQALVLRLPAEDAGRRVSIPNLPGNTASVYDITNPLRPTRLEDVGSTLGLNGALTATFAVPAPSTPGQSFSLWVGSDALVERRPLRLTTRPDPRAGLIGAEADYLVVAPPALIEGSRRLADYRAKTGLRTAVLSLSDLYDAYNFGILHPLAIRNFLADAFATWTKPPKYLVLVGDGHWDLRGELGHDPATVLMPPNLSWVDPWQGEVDSSNLLGTVGDHDALADLAIGRLPVNSPAELDAVVDKIIAYEAAPPGQWQGRQVFVDDNTDGQGNYQASSDGIVDRWSAGRFMAERIRLDDYLSTDRCHANPQSSCQEANEDVVQAISHGSSMVNYAGHASLQSWAHERVFNISDVARVTTDGHLPFVLSWSCLDGFWDHPDVTGLAETWVRQPAGGAVAAFSATGLGVANGHEILQQGVYQAVYGDHVRTVGEIALAAKRTLAAANVHLDLLQTYTLFGDPALQLRIADRPYHRLHLPSLFRHPGQ